jgi:serine/threonine-protein kinase
MSSIRFTRNRSNAKTRRTVQRPQPAGDHEMGAAARHCYDGVGTRMQIQVGRVLAGKYELVRLLGRGSMGEVWVAHHRTLGEKVALKLLTQQPERAEIEDASTATARFRFEAQVAARLSRKTRHIVQVTDHGEEDGLPYLVMELLDGTTLEGMLLRRGTMELAEVSRLVAQIARALEEAHSEGVVHRDLKPANVFLTQDEDGRLLVKLLDFGIARAIHSQRMRAAYATGKQLVFGTPGYMSPEQARASSKLDHQCDLWALATVAYEALTGDLPVPGADVEELVSNLCAGRVVPVRDRRPDLPEPLSDFFARAFSGSVEDRFASASELASAFEQAAGVQDAPALPPEEAAPVWSWRRARWPLAVAGAVVILSLGVAGVAWRARGGSAPRVNVSPSTALAEDRAPAGAGDAPSPAPPAVQSATPVEREIGTPASAPVAPPQLPSLAASARSSGASRPPRSAVAGPVDGEDTHTLSPPVPSTDPISAPKPTPPPTPPKKTDKSEVL